MSQITHVLENLSQKMGLQPTLQLENNSLTLNVDGQKNIHLEYDEDNECIYMYSRIGKLQDNLDFYKTILSANLFGTETGGGVLALDAMRNDLLLARTVHTKNLTADDLAYELESLIEFDEVWTEKLTEHTHNTSNTGASLPASDFTTATTMDSFMLSKA